MQSYSSSSHHGADDREDDSPPPLGKGDDKKGDSKATADKGERKGVINRVNRACNHCRRMKMRCVGAEDPPCKRCRNGGLECIMEKPGRAVTEGGAGEDRIRSLESQVTSIQNTLSDLVQMMRAGMPAPVSSAASNGSGHTPVNVSTTPDYGPGIPPSLLSQMQPQSASSPRGTQPFHPVTALASQPRFSPQGISPTPMLGRPSATSTYNPYAASSTTLGLSHADNAQPTAPHGTAADASRSDPSSGFRRPAVPTPLSGSWQQFSTPGANAATQHMSLPPSRAGSEGPDDILAPDEIINPLGSMSNMAGLVEAAVERAREERGRASASPVAAKRMSVDSSDHAMDERGLKKARFSSNPTSGGTPAPAVVEAQGLPQTLAPSKPKSKRKKTHTHAYPDCVDEGIVSEEEARELMGIFYAGSSNYIPCYDPNFDTWESLSIRSPFSITCIVMVGARVRDGGGPHSDVQRRCREHAQKIAMNTMFNPVARVEAVQAMSILAAFSDSGWLPSGHAVRMALDMGINMSFIKLLRTGMGKGKTPEELEDERPLVVHSRVWFCLYLMEHQMAYGMGRPAILREDETIQQCRRLLEHPLSITSDARLISTVELTALRAPLHIELTASPDLPVDKDTLKRLKQANQDFDAWERYWDRVLSDRFGKGKGDFFRESLAIQRQYAELFVNSQLLRGIREPADVGTMPAEKRALALRAMKNAQSCLDICLRGENYRNGLRYAVHYTHVCAAFAASFLIRIARLFPQELNLKKTAKDVEELARVLSDVPAGRYARSLRLIVRRARAAKVIPAMSNHTSPSRNAVPLPMTNIPPASNASTLPFSPNSMVNQPYLPTPGPGMPTPGVPATSPSNLLFSATSQILEDSPQSATEISEFDFLFAQENLERSGLTIPEGDPLPLFLDGQSLGNGAVPTDVAPFGLEQFFLPAEVDNRLAGQPGGPAFVPDLGFGTDVYW